MDGWSRLEKLDLTHNFLRALPIDFAILTKDVEVIVSRNPINDLPNKWNENFTPGAVHHTPFGYSDTQVITWVREQRWFYYSRQTVDEAIVFTTYDSHPEDGNLFKPTLHTAVAKPDTEGLTPRESVETRFFGFIDRAQ